MDIWQIKQVKLGDLIPNAKNPRKISQEKLAALQDKIERLGFHNPIKTDENMQVLGGNQRLKALLKIAGKDLIVPIMVPNRPLTEEEKQEVIITDNIADGQWDWEKLSKEWDKELTSSWGLDWTECDFDAGEETASNKTNGSLRDKFLAPPFSVLNAKSSEWQERKKMWLDKGIKSEIGRDDNLLFMSMQVKYPTYYDQKAKIEKKLGKTLSNEEFEEKYLDRSKPLSTTSVFDPVLCEVAYSWFSKDGDKIIDPFAGGSVRGIVAHELKRKYTGIDLRKEQIDANIENAKEICPKNMPEWLCGDSNKVLDDIKEKYQMCLSCPPYADLEVYSDDPADLSNMDYPDFLKVYGEIIKKLYNKLDDNSFVVWVVGEVRGKTGNYYNFIGDTIKSFINAGFNYYNEIILETMIGTSAMRATKMFQASRKVCKTHQNVLVFVKGDGKKATDRLGKVEILEITEENE